MDEHQNNEKNLKIDLSSKMVEKGLDIAKDFLDKLIMPSIEELGLFFKDYVTSFRTKNQVKLLNSTKAYCQKHNINPKTIPLKILYPLLDQASLEEDETMQEKWSILLGNLVDPMQNIQTNVFPHILSQISKKEFFQLNDDYCFFMRTMEEKSLNILKLCREKRDLADSLDVEQFALSREFVELAKKGDDLKFDFKSSNALLYEDILQEFEIANLTRLGVVKQLERRFSFNKPWPNQAQMSSVKITQLGILFVEACTEKKKSFKYLSDLTMSYLNRRNL